MKKRLAVILVLIMLLMFGACGNSDSQVTDPSSSGQSTINNTEQPTDATEGTTGATQTPTDEPTSEPTEAPTTLPTTPPTTSPTTPPTTSPVACSHNWNKASCTAPKTCSKCGRTEGSRLAHTEVVIPAKHATFSVSGLTEGAKCSVCGTITKEQQVISALGSDMVVGTDYYDKTGQTTYRYSYSFTLYENDRFNLVTLKVGSDESYALTGEDGSINYLDNGVYELIFDNGREHMYGKFVGNQFQFCDKDGNKWKDKEQRPHGNTTVNITPRAGNSVYGYKDLARNAHGKSMQELYYRIFAACEAFVEKKDNISPSNGKYIVDRINLDYYILTADEAVAVWKVFLVENPRYYWLSNSVSLQGSVLELCIDAAYADGAYRNQCDMAIEALIKACSAKLSSGMGQMEKAMVIHNFILEQMNYAYKADGKTPENAIWAHNLIGCAQKKSGVCESYAKAYQYLCKLNGVDCMVVTGYNGESHAWNVVKIDGKWYGVDCTFDETNIDKMSYNCFGMSAERMKTEYTADTPKNSGVKYLYQIPELAEQGIELVELYKNQESLGIYANIDAAFSGMTDTQGEYEVQLFNYNRKGALLLSSAAVEHQISSTQTPKVKSITICGKTTAENGYNVVTKLTIHKKLSLRCDLTLCDLDIYGNGSLDLKSKKLSCMGKLVQFSIPIAGSTSASSPSEIYLGATEQVHFWEKATVHTLSEGMEFSASYYFRNHATIMKCTAYKIVIYDNVVSVPGGISVQIGEYCPSETAPEWAISPFHLIDIFGPANVNIDKITVPGEYATILMQFGKLEEFGKVTIGPSNTMVNLVLNGKATYTSTDINGNVVDSHTESVTPEDLNVPVATLLEKSVMDKLRVCFETEEALNIPELWIDHTDEYTLNSKNQVVRK